MKYVKWKQEMYEVMNIVISKWLIGFVQKL